MAVKRKSKEPSDFERVVSFASGAERTTEDDSSLAGVVPVLRRGDAQLVGVRVLAQMYTGMRLAALADVVAEIDVKLMEMRDDLDAHALLAWRKQVVDEADLLRGRGDQGQQGGSAAGGVFVQQIISGSGGDQLQPAQRDRALAFVRNLERAAAAGRVTIDVPPAE